MKDLSLLLLLQELLLLEFVVEAFEVDGPTLSTAKFFQLVVCGLNLVQVMEHLVAMGTAAVLFV